MDNNSKNKKVAQVPCWVLISIIVLIIVLVLAVTTIVLDSTGVINIFNLDSEEYDSSASEEHEQYEETQRHDEDEDEDTIDFYTLDIGESFVASEIHFSQEFGFYSGFFSMYELMPGNQVISNVGDVPGGVSTTRGTFHIEGNQLSITLTEEEARGMDVDWISLPAPFTSTYTIIGHNQFEGITLDGQIHVFVEYSLSSLAAYFASFN
ncbi:MAG: hypothetical protein FWC79_02525 [Oscillospiraceae bacterium]|nr:hypothetical protein [Oscillospiraceae bacterium]